MMIGNFIGADRPFPSVEELQVERAMRCGELFDAGDFAVNPDTMVATIPIEFAWQIGLRLITCEAKPNQLGRAL